MKPFYFIIHPKFFGCAIWLVVLSVLQNIFLSDLLLSEHFVHVIVLVTLAVMLITNPKSVLAHAAVAVFLLLLLVASLVVERDSLLIQ